MSNIKKKVINLLKEIGITEVYKFEEYKNVTLAYDEDFDQRLKQVVDYITKNFEEELFTLYEADATLSLIWTNKVPAKLVASKTIPTIYFDGSVDHWFIGFSDTIEGIKWNNSSQFIAQYAEFSKN